MIELGVDTFGDVATGPDGTAVTQAQAVRDVVEQGVLADEVGWTSSASVKSPRRLRGVRARGVLAAVAPVRGASGSASRHGAQN